MGGPRRRFTHCIERWGTDDSAADHVAGVEDFLLAMATYQAACRRWPDARITLRRGRRVIQDTTAQRQFPLSEDQDAF
jgi:hypothetical protein